LPIVNFGLSALTAVFLILIFPRFGVVWLAPIALAPLLVACAREERWKRRFLLGWLSGFIFWFGVCYWIQFVLEVHGGLGRWGGWGTFTLFAILKGLHTAIFTALAGVLMRKSWAIPAVAAWWTGIERTHGPFGFTWLQLGNAGIDMPVPMRLAPILGVYGLSFVFAMLGCAVALLLLRLPRRDLIWLAPLALLLVLPALPAPTRGAESALVVQPNVDTEERWTTESVVSLEQRLTLLSSSSRAPLILWPEIPAPLYYPSDREFADRAAQVARSGHASFLFGVVGRAPSGGPLNSAVMFNPEGQFVDQYSKIKLVPFGEFVPPLFSWVNRITQEAGDFVPGDRVVVFKGGDHRIGGFICYESAFPDLVRQFTHAGADLLVNLSNDGYFGKHSAREQHLSLVRMRAAENRRWIVRATNDGITAAVDPAGRVTERLEPYTQLAAVMHYNYVAGETAYSRFGDWFAWSCLGLGLCIAIIHRRTLM
jgi:apolipoprotein N-acyltransferase